MSSFFTSLFSCCLGASRDDAAKAEARHARIMNMYNSDSESPDAVVSTPPPSYADIVYDRPFTCPDEKNTAILQPQPQYPSEVRRASVSSRSSVVSVPSTRLSDLTSMYTGHTRRPQTGDEDRDNASEMNRSWRSSGWYGSDQSAPPSYYAGSERSVTPTPVSPEIVAPAPVFGAQHPVMQDGWLDGLRRQAETDRSQVRYPYPTVTRR